MPPEADIIQPGALDDRLWRTLAHVNEWLRFAEAKNGATVAAALAVAFGVVSSSAANGLLNPFVAFYALAVAGQMIICATIGVVSFLPITDLGNLRPYGDKATRDNLLFFGDLAKYSPEHLLGALQPNSLGREAAFTVQQQHAASQIIINSRIAAWKYTCSKWAIRTFLSALMTPIGAWLIIKGIRATHR